MAWGRSYQINDSTIYELRRAGMDEVVLAALGSAKSGKLYDRKSFNDLLAGLGPRKLGDAERKLIHKYAQMSLLRLERIIPSRSLREWAEALIFAVIIALVVRSFLIAPFKIPSGSMYPTIEIGDHIFATMFSYGIPIPFTDVKLARRDVQRGDIVIFPFPKNPEIDYIKRVIATGGETVSIRNNQVMINGKPLEEPYSYYDQRYRSNGKERDSNFGPVKVPAGHLFVMGDNRYNSLDSRYWGFVDEKTVKGRGWIIYFSHDPEAGWFAGYRIGRIASTLQ